MVLRKKFKIFCGKACLKPSATPTMDGKDGGSMSDKNENRLALDRSSVRSVDANGFMHVAKSHLTKAMISPYYGHEIPGGVEHGLDPDKIYYGLRDPEELKKSVPTWAGLPLHIEHHIDSADDPQKGTRVGTVGDNVEWNPPYIDAPLTIWDQQAIDGIEDGSFRELSCAYRYDPEFKTGEYEGKPYDFVMRNIRGNHVALVEEGRAGPDVLVADHALIKKDKQNGGKPAKRNVLMSMADWFKGARDEELDASETVVGDGEDVSAVIEEISEKLTPEEVERLKKAVAALAPAEDADKTEDEDDDSEDFAEGVKYGEELEKDPAERGKLDREHESEGMKAVMDKCGVDAENPSESKAFAEGVKYGESLIRNPVERKKLDKEHESEGMKREEAATDEEHPVIEEVIAAVPGLSEEQAAVLREKLKKLAAAKAEAVEAATDAALKKRGYLGAADAAAIRASAKQDAVAHFKAVAAACSKVRPLVGEMDPLAFDSASAVFGYALTQAGKDVRKYDKAAWQGMVDVLLEERLAGDKALAALARDSKPVPESGPFRFLNRIKLS